MMQRKSKVGSTHSLSTERIAQLIGGHFDNAEQQLRAANLSELSKLIGELHQTFNKDPQTFFDPSDTQDVKDAIWNSILDQMLIQAKTFAQEDEALIGILNQLPDSSQLQANKKILSEKLKSGNGKIIKGSTEYNTMVQWMTTCEACLTYAWGGIEALPDNSEYKEMKSALKGYFTDARAQIKNTRDLLDAADGKLLDPVSEDNYTSLIKRYALLTVSYTVSSAAIALNIQNAALIGVAFGLSAASAATGIGVVLGIAVVGAVICASLACYLYKVRQNARDAELGSRHKQAREKIPYNINSESSLTIAAHSLNESMGRIDAIKNLLENAASTSKRKSPNP